MQNLHGVTTLGANFATRGPHCNGNCRTSALAHVMHGEPNMTPRKYAQTFGIIALLLTSLAIPVLVARRPAPTAEAQPASQATPAALAQAASR